MTAISVDHYAMGIGSIARVEIAAGCTVEEIAQRFHATLDGLTAWVRAPAGSGVEWLEVPRAMWRQLRPKVSNVLRFGHRLGKSALGSIFSLAVTVLVAVVAPYLIPIIGPLATSLIGAAVTVGAAYAAQALFPTSAPGAVAGIATTAAPGGGEARFFANVESGNNLLARDAYLPVIAGTRRISPPEIASPHPYLVGGIQSLKRIFAVDGHNELADIQVDGAPVGDLSSITTQTRSGAEDAPTSTFVDRVTRADSIGEALSTFSLSDTDLVDQDLPANSEPRWLRFSTISDDKLDEITIRLRLDNLLKTTSATATVRLPLRIRFREKGSVGDWTNLPEIHLIGHTSTTVLQEIRLRWDGDFGAADVPGDITHQFYQRVPAVTAGAVSDGSTGDQWQAAAHFVDGSDLRDVTNISGGRDGLRVTLDPAVTPKSEFEWEIIRGLASTSSALSATTYKISGTVYPFFLAYAPSSTWRVRYAQGDLLARLSIDFSVLKISRAPCTRPKTALIALQSIGQSVRNVTVEASRFVRDWDGSGWNTLTTTDNPAPHYRQILFDHLVYHGMDTALINEALFVAWRAECLARDYKVSGLFSGAATRAALAAIAVAGFARPSFSDGFGIDWFRDRSGDLPVQVFSPRNATISLQWQHRQQAAGVRASFQNAADGYRDDEIQINNPVYGNFSGYDVRAYPTIADAALVRRRATYDMLAAHYQGRQAWLIDCSIEGAICERGDLIGVVTDLVNDNSSGARVREVLDATTLRIDQDIPVQSTQSLFDAADIFALSDIMIEGANSICLVSTPTGTEQRTIISAYEDIIRVDEPFSSTDLQGAHLVLGPATRFTHRVIVSDVQRQSDLQATLVCVDEAPEIWAEMEAHF